MRELSRVIATNIILWQLHCSLCIVLCNEKERARARVIVTCYTFVTEETGREEMRGRTIPLHRYRNFRYVLLSPDLLRLDACLSVHSSNFYPRSVEENLVSIQTKHVTILSSLTSSLI